MGLQRLAVVVDGCVGQIVVSKDNRNRVPLLYRAGVVHRLQHCTVSKCMGTNANNAIWDGYTSKAITSCKRETFDAGDSVRDGYAG